jgi:hypothetical protein
VGVPGSRTVVGCGGGGFGKHMSSKNFKLAELMQQHPKAKTPGCVTC